mmetsp:Transcript_723/g.2031  ORF Transcript_723/g.2031 Transcript_723/m.2031 type:complete len:281 (-) Transcript_723:86-928(-)
MYPACYGQMLRGTHGLSVPARDPACPLTPDPFPSPEFIESDGLASGRVTPTCAVVSGRGQYQSLSASISTELCRMLEQQGKQEGRSRTGYGYVSLRQAISAAVPPSPARPQAGCMMGAECDRCHLCHWQRTGKEPQRPATAQHVVAAVATAQAAEADAHQPAATPPPAGALPSRAAAPSWDEPAYVPVPPSAGCAVAAGGAVAAEAAASMLVSLGSVGHPHGCEQACKYAGKPRGCKVGLLCNRCHLCHWTRSKDHAYKLGLLAARTASRMDAPAQPAWR